MTQLALIKPSAVRSLTFAALDAAATGRMTEFLAPHGWASIRFRYAARNDEKAEEFDISHKGVRRGDLAGFFTAVRLDTGARVIVHSDSIKMEVA